MSETPRKRKGDGRRTIKVPRSEAQRQQSRANGAHSKGPRTDAGKAASSENALVHGLSGKMLVPKAHRRTYKARSEAFGQEAGPSALLQGLAGMAALAMTRTEIVCDSRNKSAEKKARRIQAQARKRQEKRLAEGFQLWESGRRDEAVGVLASIEEGCRAIAGWWIEAEQAATNVPLGGQFPPAFWEELDTLDPAIPPCYRGYMRKSIAQWRGLDRLPREGFRITIRHVAGFWTAEADRLREASSEDVEERVAHAHADLGGEGQVRHRYLQAAQSLYRQSARQILDERRRHPARSLEIDNPEPPPPADTPALDDPPIFERGSTDEDLPIVQPVPLDEPVENPDVEDEEPLPDEVVDEDEDWLSVVNSYMRRIQGAPPDEGPSAETREVAPPGTESPDPSPARSVREGISPGRTMTWTGHPTWNTDGVGEGGIPSLELRAGGGSGVEAGPEGTTPEAETNPLNETPGIETPHAPASPEPEGMLTSIRSEIPANPTGMTVEAEEPHKAAPNALSCHPDGTASAVDVPAISVRNEPENSPQPIGNSPVAKTSPVNRGVDSGSIGGVPTAMGIDLQPGQMRIDITPEQFRERLIQYAQLPGKQVLDVDDLMRRFRARYTAPANDPDGPGGVFDTS